MTIRTSGWIVLLGAIGRGVWAQWQELIHAAAVGGTAVSFIARPGFWTKRLRKLFARQLMVIGLEPLLFVCGLAALVGASVGVQLSHWVAQAAQSQMLGQLLVTIVARELAPVLINVVIIVRSGSAMASELALLTLSGKVALMVEQGRDPFVEIVVPRILGMAVSAFCLTFVFTITALVSGFAFAALAGKGSSDLFVFGHSISRALGLDEVLNILAKSILPALFAAVCCCTGGLGVAGSFKEIPRVT